MSTTLQLGAIGATFEITVRATDLTGATVSLAVRKPDDSSATWTGSVDANGRATYTTVSGDLNVVGVYQAQLRVQGTGIDYKTEPFEWRVRPNLP